MAIQHFGELLRDMSEYTWMLSDVILGSLVPLILFLEDTEIRVAQVSPAILFFLALQRTAVFYVTADEHTLSDPFLLCRHVSIR